ncbi:Glucitol operon repressor [compost metagenome]
MIRSAKKVVMLLDASKFGKRYFSTIAHLAAIDVLVTDSGISEADKACLEESGVELHIV